MISTTGVLYILPVYVIIYIQVVVASCLGHTCIYLYPYLPYLTCTYLYIPVYITYGPVSMLPIACFAILSVLICIYDVVGVSLSLYSLWCYDI